MYVLRIIQDPSTVISSHPCLPGCPDSHCRFCHRSRAEAPLPGAPVQQAVPEVLERSCSSKHGEAATESIAKRIGQIQQALAGRQRQQEEEAAIASTIIIVVAKSSAAMRTALGLVW